MKKNLTIVIPTYNMEKYLDTCLTSLILDDKKIMMKLEVLVVIDGANDRSSEIAHAYQNLYPNTFRVIDKENGNYGSCVNRGLKEAEGKYIKILDADDSFNTKGFAKFLQFLESANYDLILTDFDIVNDKGDVTANKKRIFKPGKYKFSDLSDDFIKNSLSMHEVTYKTDNIRQINYVQTEGISYTDQEWIFTPMITVNTIYYLDEVVYKYLLGRDGQTVDPKVQSKAIPQKFNTCLNLINTYSNIRIGRLYVEYLDYKLSYLLYVVYEYFLVTNITRGGIELIMQLENALLQNLPCLYISIERFKTKHLKIKFVREWRLKHYESIPISVKFYLLILSLIKRIVLCFRK